jgi:chemotaxis protein MotB
VTAGRRPAAGGSESEGPGMERWLLTYADMITLLLALFVILFALSSINEKKFVAFKLGLSQTFTNSPVTKASASGNGLLQHTGLISHSATASASAPVPAEATTGASTPSLSQIAAEIEQALQAAGLTQDASTTTTTRSVVVQVLADKAYFALDSATLGTVGDQVVDTIAGVITGVPNDVAVEGYTDNQPIYGGPYASNWQLSAARAANVAQRLATVDGIAEARLSAIGYGETHPLVPDTSPANQAENRRVDVVILAPGTSGTSTP